MDGTLFPLLFPQVSVAPGDGGGGGDRSGNEGGRPIPPLPFLPSFLVSPREFHLRRTKERLFPPSFGVGVSFGVCGPERPSCFGSPGRRTGKKRCCRSPFSFRPIPDRGGEKCANLLQPTLDYKGEVLLFRIGSVQKKYRLWRCFFCGGAKRGPFVGLFALLSARGRASIHSTPTSFAETQ